MSKPFLHPVQFDILKFLNKAGAQNFEQINEYLEYSAALIRKYLPLLVQQQYISESLDFDLNVGRPCKIYELTEKGMDYLR